jgi:2-polyprenyl-3-methyl-5-hydroxy-6-metoxy-1,4-benzoquinol methylase
MRRSGLKHRKENYQFNLSEKHKALLDLESRVPKYQKIISVVHDFQPHTENLKCLDVGCSGGIISSLLATHFKFIIGVDIDDSAIREAKKGAGERNASFFLTGDVMNLSFADQSFDIAICNHIYEHVPDASRMMSEISRVLKKDGICYFAAGNKYVFVEGHYQLPFLSWLPKKIANLYLKLFRNESFYYENHLSLKSLRKLVDPFRIVDYTLKIIKDPEKFFATDLFRSGSLEHKLLCWVSSKLYFFCNTYIWVLVKEPGNTK